MLSTVDKETVHLTNIGRIIDQEFQRTSSMRENISLGPYIIMPNHIHLVMMFHDRTAIPLEEESDAPLHVFGGSHGGSLLSVIGNFKSSVTSRVRKMAGDNGMSVWQRGFYEHIIPDEKDLIRITDYIMTNPITWHYDMENPNRVVIAPTQEGTRGVPLRDGDRLW